MYILDLSSKKRPCVFMSHKKSLSLKISHKSQSIFSWHIFTNESAFRQTGSRHWGALPREVPLSGCSKPSCIHFHFFLLVDSRAYMYILFILKPSQTWRNHMNVLINSQFYRRSGVLSIECSCLHIKCKSIFEFSLKYLKNLLKMK